MRHASLCKVTKIREKRTAQSEIVESMLRKSDVDEYIYGRLDDTLESWSVALVDDEIYARRAISVDGVVVADYFCAKVDESRELYDTVARDVSRYFSGYLDPRERGLEQLLSAFGRKYSSFLSRVMFFWRDATRMA